jgi:hypothetical protein
MRKYYRKYLLSALLNVAGVIVFVALAIMISGWWSLSFLPVIAWEALGVYVYLRKALTFRRYIGHPLEYLLLLRLELKP